MVFCMKTLGRKDTQGMPLSHIPVLRGTCTSDCHGWQECNRIAGAILAMCNDRCRQTRFGPPMYRRQSRVAGAEGRQPHYLPETPARHTCSTTRAATA